MTQAELEAMIKKIADGQSEKLNWQQSIVDLMKLLKLVSSLSARKQLAQELGYKGSLDGSAEMDYHVEAQTGVVMATNSLRLVRFSILGIAGTIAFASVANADPVGVALVESSNSASVALMDYVQAGQVIRLGPHETIVLSYMARAARNDHRRQCDFGTDRSDVQFGSVERVTQSAIPEKSRSRAGRP